MKKRFLALLMSTLMIFGALAGCGQSGDETDKDTETGSQEPEQTADVTVASIDYDAAYAMYSPDTVVMTINGIDVTWDVYFYWLYTMANQYEYYGGGTIDWSMELDAEYTYESYAKEYAKNVITQYWVIEGVAGEMGIELTEEDLASIETMYQEGVDYYGAGDEQAFEEYLASIYFNKENFNRMNEILKYYEKIFESYFGKDGSELSDEDALSYAEDAGYMYAKHILFRTIDDAGESLGEEVEASKKAEAEAVLAELQACATTEALLARFDELMNEKSEDPGIANYPDGYYFVDGEMEENFQAGTEALQPNELSGLVESYFGYHIILRLPLNPDDVTEYGGNSLRYIAAMALFNNMADEWFETAEIVYMDDFESLKLENVFVTSTAE